MMLLNGHHELLLNYLVGIRLSQLSGNVISTYAGAGVATAAQPPTAWREASSTRTSCLWAHNRGWCCYGDLEQQLTFPSLNFENELNDAASSFWSQMSRDVCEGRHLSSVNWSGNLRVTLLSITSCCCVSMTTEQLAERISFMLIFPP